MADTGDKTEKASGRKLREARRRGQSVRSRDLAAAVGILASFKLFVWLVPGYLEDFRGLFAQGFAPLARTGTLDNAWTALFVGTMGLLAKMLLPLFVVPAAAIAAAMVPGGWSFSTAPLAPDLSRLAPASYARRLLGSKHWLEFGASVLKAALLAAVLTQVVRSGIAGYLQLQGLPLNEALLSGGGLMIDGVTALCAVFLLFAAIDVPAQVFFFLRGQRMSKREQKDEHKTSEGSPQVRQRIRQLQRQIARRSVRKTVPTADVVIVNPEHYAVALKYDEGRAEAPFVVAKGIDEMALYIREVALEHGVEVLPLPPLARAIYATSQVQQQIPMALYQAVARVLTYVLQLKAFRGGSRASLPALPADLAVPSRLSDGPAANGPAIADDAADAPAAMPPARGAPNRRPSPNPPAP
jgi:flagellar biosynthetic protein FlhB